MEKPSEFPSLKKLCLQTLAYQFENILYLNQLEQFEKSLITVIPKNSAHPTRIAKNNTTAFFDTYPCQYLGTLDSPHLISLKAFELYFFDGEGENPALSSDGTKLIGWSKEPIGKETLCCIDIPHKVFTSCLPWSEFRRKGHFHYAFLPNGNIIFRDNRSLYTCKSDDLIANGENALKSLYKRSDNQKYPSTYYKALHAFTDSLIVCAGPDEKSFELFEKQNSIWKIFSTINTQNNIIHATYGIHDPLVATCEKNALKTLQIYHLSTQKHGSISIKSFCCYPFAATFSPDGKYLACGTDKERGEIDIVDCSNSEKPFVCKTISLVSNFPISQISWHSTGIYAQDGRGHGRYDIMFNSLNSLITAYKESKKSSKAESNNTNASFDTFSLR